MEITQVISQPELISHIVSYKKGEHLFYRQENFRLFILEKGKCRFLIDRKYVEAKEGDIIAIQDQSFHSILVEGEMAKIRIIQFSIRILLNAVKRVKPLKTHISAEEIDRIENLRKNLKDLMEIADKEYETQKTHDDPFFQEVIASVYFLLMRYFSLEENSAATKNDRKEFYQIAEYVNKHYKEEINVSIIANNLYIPRGRLASLFSKYSGTGLNEYINALRIKSVNQLLCEGKCISEAAFESGFQSIRTFNNTYKEYMGITPSEYIKKYTNA